MSIANLCVLRGYSNEEGEFEVRLRKPLTEKGLPDTGSVCGQHGEGRELWKSVENSKAEPFTRIVKDAAPRRRSVCYPPTTHCWSSNRNIATKPGDAEECPQENSR